MFENGSVIYFRDPAHQFRTAVLKDQIVSLSIQFRTAESQH